MRCWRVYPSPDHDVDEWIELPPSECCYFYAGVSMYFVIAPGEDAMRRLVGEFEANTGVVKDCQMRVPDRDIVGYIQSRPPGTEAARLMVVMEEWEQ